jgi:hypothetical protein
MRKCVAIIIMICLTASLLMSCGSGGGDKNEGAQSKTEAQAEAQQQTDAVQETAQHQEGTQSETEATTIEAQADQQPEKQLTRELPSQTDGYLIFVKDANTDEPLADVRVQFCSDTECILGETGDDGTAGFDREAGTYTIHILQPPEGYAADDTEYAAPLTPGTTTIVLHAETGS